MKKKKNRWRSKKISKHHVRPRSRGGGNDNNIVLLSENVHKAWHILFGNRTPEEAEEYLKELHELWYRKARKWNPPSTSSS